VSILRSLDDVARTIESVITPGRRTIIGITGAPGAGKSTIAAQVVELLAPSAALLPMDGFHLPQATLVELGRRERMGAPDTFDVEGFLSKLADIRGAGPAGASPLTDAVENSGNHVLAPGFDREIEEPVPDALDISPEFSRVVVEGNYLLLDESGWERTAPLLDVTFFVEVPENIRLERLIARHIRFGKSAEDARAWALGPDQTNAEVITATAHRADHRIALG
jgi:pantothenate kinase